jgi:hypothetical protein
LKRRLKIALLLTGLVLAILAQPLAAQRGDWQLTDGASVHPAYRGPVPEKSDVILSTRFRRPQAVEIIKAYGANRVEWVYSTDKAYIQSLKAVASRFGGALHSTMTLPDSNGLALDFDGNPIVPPWMAPWGAKLISIAHPSGRKFIEDAAKRYVDLGADSIQFDDPLLQVQSGYRGGDFSPLVLDEFRKFLVNYPDQAALSRLGIVDPSTFDYRRFLTDRFGIKNADDYRKQYRNLPTTPLWMSFHREYVRSFFSDFRATLHKYRGSYFPLSMNLNPVSPSESRPDFFLAEFADYAISETPIGDLDLLQIRAATLRAQGVGFVPSILPKSRQENRLAIATLFSLGGTTLVPWDVYYTVGPEEKPDRFFGAPEDYADLFHFVRRNAALFDRFEQTAVVGVVVPVDKYRARETVEFVRRLTRFNVPFAFVLAGGTHWRFTIDPALARNYKLLVTVNEDRDFSPDALQTLAALPLPRMRASELSDHAVETLSPFVAASSSSGVRFYPRAMPGRTGTEVLVVHAVDTAADAPVSGAPACARTVGIKGDSILGRDIKSANWHSGSGSRKAPWTRDGVNFLIRIPECVLWGTLRLELG